MSESNPCAVNHPPRRGNRWWTAAAGISGLLLLGWVFVRVDYQQMRFVLREADSLYLALVPLAIGLELLVRAWKWRQLLFEMRSVGTLRLFGALMAGYFANLLVPIGISPIVRAWLIARLESLKVSAMLATVAIDRFIDGVVFVAFVALALIFFSFPGSASNIRTGLAAGALVNLIVFSGLLFALARYKKSARNRRGRVNVWLARLPERFSGPAERVATSFAEGVVWPHEFWRGAAIIVASFAIKLIAASHFLFAGLAFNVLLYPADYIFLLVFLGFLIILARIARIPGSFLLGAVFALDLLGVPREPALAMTLLVYFSTTLVVALIGGLALLRSGVTLAELRCVRD